MSLYENWSSTAYGKDGGSVKEVWDVYLPLEQKIYEEILSLKSEIFTGKIKDIGDKYHMSNEFVCGFLDGINETTLKPLDIETLDEDSEISIEIDFEKLYKKMIELKAEHLSSLPQWDNVFDEETRQRFYKEQKASRTFVRENAKIGRNDPCPCGSGKKFKKCCGGL